MERIASEQACEYVGVCMCVCVIFRSTRSNEIQPAKNRENGESVISSSFKSWTLFVDRVDYQSLDPESGWARLEIDSNVGSRPAHLV